MAAKRKHRAVPLAERRGLQGPFDHDLSLFTLLVRADIGRVTDRFAREIGARRVREAVGHDEAARDLADVFGTTFVLFQYRGHPWTTAIHRIDEQSRFTPKLARRLSENLETRAIFAGDHDTAGTIDYWLYDGGRLAEVFHWHEPVRFHQLTAEEFARLEAGGAMKPVTGYYAGSRVRGLPVAELDALSRKGGEPFNRQVEWLVDDFLRSQDAFLAHNWDGDEETESHPLAVDGDRDLVGISVVEA